MNLRISQFYLHPQYGVMKFTGYTENGLMMFDRFDRWGDGGFRPQNRITVTHIKSKLRPIPPPE